ncbi:hypothetical protein FAZ19_06925 [Sphingobacterium alkalisoli]|uniref:Uncharacterized protein n=1 Tax=Sphingobacterium alkalisoli TaxID=1874115 RepID=A0A4U0H4Z3_9SPHI|nr:hypothetical protein [Sphingobacterium alkalisoli]TJY66646.1 hypothetical protein FAZ19_06925 [Sphingobacterium alkalisoli]GGH15101.1 hypothetical protein GCM10011418_16540 [Sphingobacterium alkalisoli]
MEYITLNDGNSLPLLGFETYKASKEEAIEKLIQNANITLTNGNEWLWNCPECSLLAPEPTEESSA